MQRCLVVVLSLVLLFTPFSNPVVSAEVATEQTVTFLDVGQGDSALIQDGAGFDVLIDGGKPEAGSKVLSVLRQQGVYDLDVILASHADSDHIGGLIAVLQASDITVHHVLYNGYPGSTATWDSFVGAAASDGLALEVVQFPLVLTWGGMTAHVLNPPAGLSNPETNDASVVLRLDFGDINYLFTGDISSTIEAQVVARQTPIASEVLKIAHHGSAYSSSDSFLAAVDPLSAVISVGANSYGHPSPDMLTRLTSSGAATWRTDQTGNVLVTSNGISYSVGQPLLFPFTTYLPLVMQADPPPPPPTPTPTPSETSTPTDTPTSPPPTSTPTPSETPTPTDTPTSPPTQPPVATTGNVQITYIFYDGVVSSQEPDEYVQIQNQDNKSIQLQGWTLRDIANHVYTFPSFVMTAGQTCRIYTNQSHPEHCGFNYGSSASIWNNTGDSAYLSDSSGTAIDQYSY